MKYSTQVLFTFIIITLIEVSTYSILIKPPIIMYALMYISIFLIFNIALRSTEFTDLPVISKNLFKFYWLYSLFIIIFGVVQSTSYWDYKYIAVSHVPGIVASLAIIIGAKFKQNLNLFKFIINILFPFAILLGFIVWSFDIMDDYIHATVILVTSIFFFILAFPFLEPKHKYLVIFISIFSIYVEPNHRSNIMTIIASWLCVLFYYLVILKPRIINLISTLIILLPLILLQYGIQGKLDIFKYLSESNIDTKISKANTRSLLYEEVLWSLKKGSGSVLFGGGASAGHLSEIYYEEKTAKRANIRYATEVGFLNTLFKSGLIGVLVDLLIILIPAYIAVNRSNNNLSKMIGFYLIFCWIFYFVERPIMLNSNYFLFYLIIGLCLSKTFRECTDVEIKYFFKSL